MPKLRPQNPFPVRVPLAVTGGKLRMRTGPSIVPGIADDYHVVLNSYGRPARRSPRSTSIGPTMKPPSPT